jgi:hypothetical protein
MTPSETAKAYGALWRSPTTDTMTSDARRRLLSELSREDQRLGIAWAVETFGAMTDVEMITADIRCGHFPSRSYGS